MRGGNRHHSGRYRRPGRMQNGRVRSAQRPHGAGPYRSRKGILLGVCRGVAEYFDVSVTGMRVLVLCLALITGVWPLVGGYILAAFLMRLGPVVPPASEADAEFYDTYATSRSMGVQRLKRTYDNLDRRIQRIESIVTAREYDWERRLNETPDRDN